MTKRSLLLITLIATISIGCGNRTQRKKTSSRTETDIEGVKIPTLLENSQEITQTQFLESLQGYSQLVKVEVTETSSRDWQIKQSTFIDAKPKACIRKINELVTIIDVQDKEEDKATYKELIQKEVSLEGELCASSTTNELLKNKKRVFTKLRDLTTETKAEVNTENIAHYNTCSFHVGYIKTHKHFQITCPREIKEEGRVIAKGSYRLYINPQVHFNYNPTAYTEKLSFVDQSNIEVETNFIHTIKENIDLADLPQSTGKEIKKKYGKKKAYILKKEIKNLRNIINDIED